LKWNYWIRQIHRWLSIIFTLTVVANFVTMALGTSRSWIVYSPLPFLFLLMFTGLYMFALPYAGKRAAPALGWSETEAGLHAIEVVIGDDLPVPPPAVVTARR
jgi:hypothetical protein